jgi:MraZ protein
VARFFGRHEHSLDDKGRVILPAKFRSHFEHGGYLAPEQDGCLSLWTPDQFEVQMDAMMERASTSRSDRNLVRLWAYLEGEVLVLGAIDRVELWDRQTWDEKVLPEEARLTMGDDG